MHQKHQVTCGIPCIYQAVDSGEPLLLGKGPLWAPLSRHIFDPALSKSQQVAIIRANGPLTDSEAGALPSRSQQGPS